MKLLLFLPLLNSSCRFQTVKLLILLIFYIMLWNQNALVALLDWQDELFVANQCTSSSLGIHQFASILPKLTS